MLRRWLVHYWHPQSVTKMATSGSSVARTTPSRPPGTWWDRSVESALLEHPAVAEAAVIGKPDPVIGELVKAFVALKPGFNPCDDLQMDLLGFGRKKLGSAVAPKEIEFVEYLPKTRSGKIMRRLLKSRELGLPEGDVSTLETTE
jgi:acetyl-CoA synthetase